MLTINNHVDRRSTRQVQLLFIALTLLRADTALALRGDLAASTPALREAQVNPSLATAISTSGR
jgi:hypothetical protein